MDKVVVTGGSGYIGSEIIKRLISQNIKPYIFLRKNSKISRLSSILSKCEIVECDISDFGETAKSFKLIKPEIIIHLASVGVYSYTDNSFDNNRAMIDSNIKGTLNLLNSAKDNHCQAFINTGSCFEYGSKEGTFSEQDTCNPENLYGVTKVVTTMLGQMFYKKHGLPVTTTRPFTTYGPLEGEGRFITTVIRKCLKNEKVALIKETVTRDYIFVDDVVDGYFAVLSNVDKLAGEIVNISTGIATTLEQTASLIIRLTNAKDSTIEKGAFPKRPGEILSLAGAADKARDLIGWNAKYTLESGLKKTIDFISSGNLL